MKEKEVREEEEEEEDFRLAGLHNFLFSFFLSLSVVHSSGIFLCLSGV